MKNVLSGVGDLEQIAMILQNIYKLSVNRVSHSLRYGYANQNCILSLSDKIDFEKLPVLERTA